MILINRLYNVFLLISGAIKPYVLALFTLRINSAFIRLTMIFLGLIITSYFGEQLLFLFVAKWSYFSPEIGGFSLGTFIWIMEIIVIAILAISSRVFYKKDITFVLLICILASGVSMNVASRIFVVSVFYLLALRLHANAGK